MQALSNVLEDDELNKQDAAIESMISMEKGYLLEIEQAEREQMPHDIADDEEEDDPELGVCILHVLSSNCVAVSFFPDSIQLCFYALYLRYHRL